jgi:hypothetical protein
MITFIPSTRPSLKYVCLQCRIGLHDSHTCPRCKKLLVSIGENFRTPKKTDVKKWKILEYLVQEGYDFHICRHAYDQGNITEKFPNTMEQARNLIKQRKAYYKKINWKWPRDL